MSDFSPRVIHHSVAGGWLYIAESYRNHNDKGEITSVGWHPPVFAPDPPLPLIVRIREVRDICMNFVDSVRARLRSCL